MKNLIKLLSLLVVVNFTLHADAQKRKVDTIYKAPTSSGLGKPKASLRNDNAVERTLIKDRTPLAYEHIREDDAIYRQRVWREIDIREKINLPFRYSAEEDNGSQLFIGILINSVRDGFSKPDGEGVAAFSAEDDRFTKRLDSAAFETAMSPGGVDIIKIDHSNDPPEFHDTVIIAPRVINLDSIYKFRIKEDIVFDKESGRMHTRILGIAPMMSRYNSLGEKISDPEPLFWVYYPELRSTLAKYEVYNPKNYGLRMTWEELFESRMFSSYIVKTTLDNPLNQSLKEYIKDPLFRLLEGENIKEKIFNYEQGLWSY